MEICYAPLQEAEEGFGGHVGGGWWVVGGGGWVVVGGGRVEYPRRWFLS